MHISEPILASRKSALAVSVLTFGAGAAGMGMSFLFLASAHHLDVIAGAAGFVGGSILASAGLVAIAILSRSPLAGGTVSDELRGSIAFAPPWVEDRWLAHFRRNHENRPEPDWHAPVTLAPDVVRSLVKSLAQFELGDGGGPACLIAWNAEQLRASGAGTRALVDLWFAEEREHARLLGAAVARFGGRCIRGHWSFTAFCLVRKYCGVRFELTVLLLTEIVSTVYYRLLRRHGKDVALRSMCRLILRDEAGHIAFHRDRLAGAVKAGHLHCGPWWETRFRALGLAAATMLWVNHASALCAAGADRAEFYHEVWMELSRFVRRLRHEAVEWAEVGVQATEPLHAMQR
jgi:hypothetical protein